MKKLTEKQASLLLTVKENSGCTTADLRRILGHRQAYDSFLRDRLWTLERDGRVSSVETLGKKYGQVLSRRWYSV